MYNFASTGNEPKQNQGGHLQTNYYSQGICAAEQINSIRIQSLRKRQRANLGSN